MLTECIILAGGKGTRLKKITGEYPKVLAPVKGKAFLHYQLKHLKKYRLKNFILSLGFGSIFVKAYCLAESFKINYTFADEKTPLGTGGGIKNALQFARSRHVLVINGDSFFDIDYCELYKQHLKKKALCTVALKPMKNFSRFGSVEINSGNKITAFNEKKFKKAGLINAGVYIIDKEKFLKMRFKKAFSFEKDFLEKHFRTKPIYGFPFDEYFIDIGIPEDYNQAQKEF